MPPGVFWLGLWSHLAGEIHPTQGPPQPTFCAYPQLALSTRKGIPVGFSGFLESATPKFRPPRRSHVAWGRRSEFPAAPGRATSHCPGGTRGERALLAGKPGEVAPGPYQPGRSFKAMAKETICTHSTSSPEFDMDLEGLVRDIWYTRISDINCG